MLSIPENQLLYFQIRRPSCQPNHAWIPTPVISISVLTWAPWTLIHTRKRLCIWWWMAARPSVPPISFCFYILECEVKWALESITMNKLVEVMEFQLSYFKSWKMMLWKCCTLYASKFGKLSSGHRTGLKVQFSFQCQRMLKLPHNCTHLTH